MENNRKSKTLNELTIKNDFMFAAVMLIVENCKRLLEMVLGIVIESITVSKEKSIIYHPEYKGVRLDVIAKDENRTHYNVEMQVQPKKALGKRSRYYHSQIDMELLERGEYYESLPNTYVIFVCDFDPFGKRKYKYSFRNLCLEDNRLELKEGCETIFLSTKGKNEDEVPKELMKFMRYDFVKLPYKTPKSKVWVDAYKGEGAYYTLKNLIMFHNCHIQARYSFYTTDESMSILKSKLDEYRGEGYRMFALMKKVIEDNNFDFNKRMAELGK